jgi:anti-sigma factor RsiW
MLKLVVGGQISKIPQDVSVECLIMAYVDGELDEAGRHHVEALLKTSAKARQIAEMMQLSCKLVRSAFPKKAEETV